MNAKPPVTLSEADEDEAGSLPTVLPSEGHTELPVQSEDYYWKQIGEWVSYPGNIDRRTAIEIFGLGSVQVMDESRAREDERKLNKDSSSN